MLNQSMPYPPDSRFMPMFAYHSNLSKTDEQKRWPVPSLYMLTAFFALGFFAPMFVGKLGIVTVFFLATLFPSKGLRQYLVKGDLASILMTITPVMILGNFDAIGDLLGNETFRFSWILLVLGTFVVLFRAWTTLKGPLIPCCLAVAGMVSIQIASTFGNTDILKGVESNLAYLLAFLTSMIVLVKKNGRDTFMWQMCLVSVVNSGFCAFEILNPSSGITISSSQSSYTEQTVRSAGLYANAIASGLMTSNFVLLASVTCTKLKPSINEKISLLGFAAISGVGVLATFSRSAALAFFLAGVFTAFRLSNNKFGRFVQYLPFALLLILASFFGLGEYLSSKGDLHGGASKRYTMVKDAMMGDFTVVKKSVNERLSVLQPTQKYWSSPKFMGEGFGFVTQNRIFPPHNMIILLLVEIGWFGLLFYFGMTFFLCGFGNWQFKVSNIVLFLSILIPLALLTLESHSLFTRRYFAIYFAELILATRILFNAKARRL